MSERVKDKFLHRGRYRGRKRDKKRERKILGFDGGKIGTDLISGKEITYRKIVIASSNLIVHVSTDCTEYPRRLAHLYI